MLIIPLQAIPNQTFTVQLDQIIYDFNIHTCGTGNAQIAAVTLSINNMEILTGERLVSNQLMIPYQYLENGNFVLITANEEYPNYTQFNVTQYLIYASNEELAAIRTLPVVVGVGY